MTKLGGINLDIQPHHVKRGAEQAHANNRRERRVNAALLGKEVIIRHEHRSNGGKARKRALELLKSYQARAVADEAPESRRGRLNASEEAVADLARVFGYPPAVIPPMGGKVHKLAVESDGDDEIDAAWPVTREKVVRHGFEKRYREVEGGTEKFCIGCKQWIKFDPEHWQRHTAKGVAWWDSRCRPCSLIKRRELWQKKHGKRKA